MSFDHVPDEIVGKILCHLLDDPISFINFSLASKRIKRISCEITSWPQWIKNCPLSFKIHNNLESYSWVDCQQHGSCAGQIERTGFKCEVLTKKMASKVNSQSQSKFVRAGIFQHLSGEDEHTITSNNCYYHRLFCMLNSKYINFSSVKFRNAYLFERGCVRAVKDILRTDRYIAEFKIRALVQLELFECYITLDWLNTTLNEFHNIRHLGLDQVTFMDSTLLVDHKHYAARKLVSLKIKYDRTMRMTDSIFMFFLENLPAVELDLTGTRIEFNRRIIERYYPNFSFSNAQSLQPCDYIFTYPFILSYLRRYHSITKHLNVSETNMSLVSLKRIILDHDLKHLKITATNCPMLNQQEQTKFMEMFEIDSSRVMF